MDSTVNKTFISSQYNTLTLLMLNFDLLCCFNPFKLNIISHFYHLDMSISVLRVVGWYVTFIFKF